MQLNGQVTRLHETPIATNALLMIREQDIHEVDCTQVISQFEPLISSWNVEHHEMIAAAFPDTVWCLHFEYTPIINQLTLEHWHKVSKPEDMYRWN